MEYSYKINVCIIGAGPAGLVCAFHLAKFNIQTLLIDKSKFPRNKVCGDGITMKAIHELARINLDFEKKILKDSNTLPSYGIDIISPEQRQFNVFSQLKKNHEITVLVKKREIFDYNLLEEVRKQKEIIFLSSIKVLNYIKVDGAYLIKAVHNSKEVTIYTNLIIDAQGAYSVFVRQHLKLKQYNNNSCIGVRGYFERKKPSKNNTIELYFLKELLPGYFWIFDLPNGIANVGYGTTIKNFNSLKTNYKILFHQLIENYPLISERIYSDKIIGGIQTHLLPVRRRNNLFSGENFLLTGDAASLIDPFTGEGISNASISGRIAAQIAKFAVANNDYSARFLKQYDNLINEEIGKELRSSFKLRRFLKYPKLLDYIFKNADKSRSCKNIISAMFVDFENRKTVRPVIWYLISPKFLFYRLKQWTERNKFEPVGM